MVKWVGRVQRKRTLLLGLLATSLVCCVEQENAAKLTSYWVKSWIHVWNSTAPVGLPRFRSVKKAWTLRKKLSLLWKKLFGPYSSIDLRFLLISPNFILPNLNAPNLIWLNLTKWSTALWKQHAPQHGSVRSCRIYRVGWSRRRLGICLGLKKLLCLCSVAFPQKTRDGGFIF